MNNYQWWEKTVEYAFVKRIMPEGANPFPLDGKPETWFGDLILSQNGRFRLIEFKANSDRIFAEFHKYKSAYPNPASIVEETFPEWLNNTYPDLAALPGAKAHWIVFGNMNAKNGFQLWGLPYVCNPATGVIALESDKDLPTETGANLTQYMAALKALRGEDEGAGGMVMAHDEQGNLLIEDSHSFYRIATTVLSTEQSLHRSSYTNEQTNPKPTPPIMTPQRTRF